MMQTPKLHGFTLIEVLVVLAIAAILTLVSVSQLGPISDQIAFDNTYREMLLIRTGLIGDLDSTNQGFRNSFGYLGDIGTIPTTAQGLDALINQPNKVNSYALETTSRLNMGWRGPYMPTTTGVDWTMDEWNRPYVYDADASPPYFLSYGADGVAGGTGTDADIRMDLDAPKTTATVTGIINTNGTVYAGAATVTMYYPDGLGGLTSVSTDITAADKGVFSLDNIPFGVRAIKVDVPDASSPTTTIGPTIFAVDRDRDVVPSSFIDLAPGTSGSVCDNSNNVAFKSGSFLNDTVKDRIYFSISVASSIAIDSFSIQTSAGASRFLGIVLGNEHLSDSPSNPGFYGAQPGQHYVPIDVTPEISFAGNYVDSNGVSDQFWKIPASPQLNGYLDFVDTATITWVDLRLGCNVVRLQ